MDYLIFLCIYLRIHEFVKIYVGNESESDISKENNTVKFCVSSNDLNLKRQCRNSIFIGVSTKSKLRLQFHQVYTDSCAAEYIVSVVALVLIETLIFILLCCINRIK